MQWIVQNFTEKEATKKCSLCIHSAVNKNDDEYNYNNDDDDDTHSRYT